MKLLGYAGPPSGPMPFDEFSHYGARHCGASPTVRDDRAACLLWSADTARRGRWIVALAGHPLQRGGQAAYSSRLTAADVAVQFEARGAQCLQDIAGSFCLAAIHAESGQTVLAVDPLGIEKLCYARDGQGIVFGADAFIVAGRPGTQRALRLQSLYDYLHFHVVPGPQTVFRDVDKLPPGHYAELEHGTLRVHRYWAPQFATTRQLDLDTAATGLSDALRTAVRAAEPDDATGAFLSGGLDSSSVAGFLAQQRPAGRARTFSIGFDYPEYNELDYARRANRHFQCEGNEFIVRGDDIVAGFSKIAAAFDEPFGNSSALPVYYCAKFALESGVSHLLAGDGGDELFAGNSRYVEQRVFERYFLLPGVVRRGLMEPVLSESSPLARLPVFRKAASYIRQANLRLPRRLDAWNLLNRAGAEHILHADFSAAVDQSAPARQMQQVWDLTPGGDTLSHMLYYDWYYTLAYNDLRKVESMCALAGVRVSYPMLHPAVVDLSTRLTSDPLLLNGQLRGFYKRAMAGFLPEQILHKKKHGFGLPFGLWLRDSAGLRQLIADNLSDFRQRRLINPAFLDRLQHLHGSEDASYYGVFIWVFAMLEQWLREHRMST